MRILRVRNVHEALPHALRLLDQEGIERPSRNGPVLLGPSVTTLYEKPCERVLFWSARDANPFFHLYESLWMLAGREDVAGPARYAKNIASYSDDGEILYGAYGWRWRHWYLDQLATIARRLQENSDDRRCVLQMWDTELDLDHSGKDVPCNVIATFQRGINGELNLTVFCRSNDIIWGAYGANAVHFSFLLEYLALWIGCPVGTYTQVSVNWHAYLDTLISVKQLRPDHMNFVSNPYTDNRVKVIPMVGTIQQVDEAIADLLAKADNGFASHRPTQNTSWYEMVYHVLWAHEIYRTLGPPQRYTEALEILEGNADWVVAAREWIQRRQANWQIKQEATHL